ncbi:MAG TPA: VTT domain-containing protein [Alphaproteobacteria bacterium]|nr:VTT domain-containing protein [Alphaproteobacteria bacterium]
MGILEIGNKFIHIVLHIEEYLGPIVAQYGAWTYLFLFLIVFLETGFVLTPFLPGDSLLFVVGTMARLDIFNIWLLFILLSAAAILGDTCNYFVGKIIGQKIIRSKRHLIKKEHLDQTRQFFHKHGPKTIILARFVPIVRTFAPFMAGVGKMDYWKFLSYNVAGGILWVGSFLFLGYFFGGIPWVEANFSLVVIAIVLASFIPLIYIFIRDHFKKLKEKRSLKKLHARKN